VLLSIEFRPEMTSRLAFFNSKSNVGLIPACVGLATSYSLLHQDTKTSTYKLQLPTFPHRLERKMETPRHANI
jgi:hypothetical protein